MLACVDFNMSSGKLAGTLATDTHSKGFKRAYRSVLIRFCQYLTHESVPCNLDEWLHWDKIHYESNKTPNNALYFRNSLNASIRLTQNRTKEVGQQTKVFTAITLEKPLGLCK